MTTITGCAVQGELKANVAVVEKQPYFAPSGFSPDGDGLNDTYEFFVDQSIAELKELLIFDRWGNIAFVAKSLDEVNWDGKINGVIADKGVYAYVAKLVGKDGAEIVGSGSIMVIR